MIGSIRLSLMLLALLVVAPLHAVQVDEILPDPALETRARALSHDLRCMVCQNQSIDDSEAPLARDLRLLVRERLKAGDSDSQVIDYLVARYGEFVLMRPVFSWRNALLWGTPVIVLLLGGGAAVLALRRRRTDAKELAALTPEEEARVQALLAGPPDLAGRDGA